MPFRRPVGAPVDVKELEYIAALHQTCLPVCRENATVSSTDIVRFLRSRFGLQVSHTDARTTIVSGLGGGMIGKDVIQRILEQLHEELEEEEEQERQGKKTKTLLGIQSRAGEVVKRLRGSNSKNHGENSSTEEEPSHVEEEQPEAYLDLVQLLSIILIPTIARAGKELQDEFQDALDQDESQDGQTKEDKKSCCPWNPIQIYKQRRAAKREQRKHEEYESLRPKPEGMIEDVLQMLLAVLYSEEESAGLSERHSKRDAIEALKEKTRVPIVSFDLIKSILDACGERERVMDNKLIHEMVQAAGGPGTPLDEYAFARALTSDLTPWEVGSEDRLSTVHYDVWKYDSRDEKKPMDGTHYAKNAAETKESDAEKGLVKKAGRSKDNYVPERPLSATNIDFTVDCHGSVLMVTIIWVFFVGTAIVYGVLFQDLEAFQLSCVDSFGCRLGNTVVTWFILAVTLSLTGIVVVVPLSLGNTPVYSHPRVTLFCSFAACVFTYLPFAIIAWFRDQSVEPYSAVEQTVNYEWYKMIQNFTFALGNVLVCAFLIQLIFKTTMRCSNSGGSDFFGKVLASSNVRGSWRTKKAATRKINAMLQNAHSLHPGVSKSSARKSYFSALRRSTSTEETMSNFVLHGERYEKCGGLLWTWKRILNKELFHTEGVWINSRIYVIQAAQVTLGVILVLLALEVTPIVADAADKARADLDEYDSLPQWVYDFVPTSEQVYAAFYPATGVMIIIIVAIILIYLPSATETTLQYRCGLKPSLTSKLFNTYRQNPDTVYLNISSAIYAMTGSAVLFFLLVSLVVFLLVWDATRDFMISLIAWGIGLSITIVLKMILTMIWRKKYYAAYYRTKPFSANLSLLALEGWYIGLGGGIILGRLLQFLLAALFWLGRIDVRFLDEDVNLVGYGFDYLPFNFEKDLLAHDGHRHPYIERLGCMYMMKLKHGSKFSTNAGACWRQLFVVALMPWMMKNRVFNDQRIANAMEAYRKKKLQEHDNTATGYVRVEDAREFGDGLVTGLKTGGMGYYPTDSKIEKLPDA